MAWGVLKKMFFRKAAGVRWIVVFLGNPGDKYAETRHNAGFMAADAMEKRAGVRISRLKFKALTAVADIGGEGALLMKPQTYMNLSGGAVQEAMKFYKVPLERVIAVSDDVTLPMGKLRIRRSGSAGGHNGLKDIIAKCGGEEFPRVKIGVGAPENPEMDMADWVLSSFTQREMSVMAEVSSRAAEAVETIISRGVDVAMNAYN
jgi:PTH1 family peptidyl-tRNA hydrolase